VSYEDPSGAIDMPQRIMISYDLQFANANDFPATSGGDDQLVPGMTRVSGDPRELASGAAKVEFRPDSADSAPDPFRHSRNREQPHLAIRPRVAVKAADNLEFQL